MVSVSHTQSMIAGLHYVINSTLLVWMPSFFLRDALIMI